MSKSTYGYHMVKSGDTLWAIAHAHGISVFELALINGMRPNDILWVGAVLQIPVTGGHAGAPDLGYGYPGPEVPVTDTAAPEPPQGRSEPIFHPDGPALFSRMPGAKDVAVAAGVVILALAALFAVTMFT